MNTVHVPTVAIFERSKYLCVAGSLYTKMLGTQYYAYVPYQELQLTDSGVCQEESYKDQYMNTLFAIFDVEASGDVTNLNKCTEQYGTSFVANVKNEIMRYISAQQCRHTWSVTQCIEDAIKTFDENEEL